ncbi:hypothetical protein HDU84_009117 [Entophlyctis sp. JEL0112]|nr:hypothetical protein HDU84_009117 [Entophlyctis sp. JEL0112]
MSTLRRPLPTGVYVPTMTFFNPDTEDVDIEAVKKHAVRLAQAGVAGLVTMGSNGEAVHLASEEKIAVTRATREALDAAGFENVPVVVGASEASVRGTLRLIGECAAAGGEAVLVLPPSYYRAQVTEQMVYQYFIEVADASPLPIILYNYPGAVSGVDMDSDLLIRIAQHPNIAGTKFTCGSTGKLTRVARATEAATPFAAGSGYMAFGGICDFTVQTLVSGGSGIIAGGANVFPKVCVRVWQLYTEGKVEEAIALQRVLSKGDWVLTKAAIAGTKSALQSYFGYGGYPRRPLPRLDDAGVAAIKDGIAEKVQFDMKSDIHLHPLPAPPPLAKSPIVAAEFPRLRFSYSPSHDGWASLVVFPSDIKAGIDTHLLVLLHGLGDTHSNFITFGKRMQLPQTAVVSIGGPHSLLPPVVIAGFAVNDNDEEDGNAWFPSFDALGQDIPPTSAVALSGLAHTRNLLIEFLDTCVFVSERWGGANTKRVFLFGFSQGGCVALDLALALRRRRRAIGGVVSMCGWLEVGMGTEDGSGAADADEVQVAGQAECVDGDVLVVQGDRDATVTAAAWRLKQRYLDELLLKGSGTAADVAVIAGKGHALPGRDRGEMQRVMEFLAARMALRNPRLEALTGLHAVATG